jgi:hypothetical protein
LSLSKFERKFCVKKFAIFLTQFFMNKKKRTHKFRSLYIKKAILI